MIINCKNKAMLMKYQIKEEVSKLDTKPCLAIVQVGDVEASNRYVKHKINDCAFVGMDSQLHKLPEDVTTEEVIELLEKLNAETQVNGVIVQLPLPKKLDKIRILSTISPEKDVDGLGKFSPFTPCTPKGCMKILEDVEIEGKHAVILGRSDLVGRPLFDLLLDKNATVTVCHSKTSELDLFRLCKDADIIVSAVGKAYMIEHSNYVKSNATIVDVGINFDEETGKLVGDVCTKNIANKANVTPVPSGVGLMTRACLLENVLEAYEMQNKK